MKLRDIQAFIPGWNIVYMIREYSAGMRQVKEQERTFVQLQEQSVRDLALARNYATQRDAAKERGDLDTAKQLDAKIAELALSYLK